MRHYDQDRRIAERRLRTDAWMIVALLTTSVALGTFILIHPMLSQALACGR